MLNALELKIPPVALTILFSALMWLVSAYAATSIQLPWRSTFGPLVGSVGLAIFLAGVLACRRGKTTVNPLTPASTTTIVCSGIYRFTRNPMYLGFLLILAGWAIYLSNLLAVTLLPLFVWYLNRFQIIPEERALRAKFPHTFTAYMGSVRRWI